MQIVLPETADALVPPSSAPHTWPRYADTSEGEISPECEVQALAVENYKRQLGRPAALEAVWKREVWPSRLHFRFKGTQDLEDGAYEGDGKLKAAHLKRHGELHEVAVR